MVLLSGVSDQSLILSRSCIACLLTLDSVIPYLFRYCRLKDEAEAKAKPALRGEGAAAQPDAEREKRIKQSSHWSDARVLAATVFVTQDWRRPACEWV